MFILVDQAEDVDR